MAFLDKLGEVAKTMTEKASDGLEVNKLGGEISIEKGNIQCYHRELGGFYWAKFAVGEKLEDEAMHICDKVVASQDRIRQLEMEIEQIKADREAIQMERAEAKRLAQEELKKEEGAEAVQEKPEEILLPAKDVVEVPANTRGQKFCSNCGGARKVGQRYCIFCGKTLE